MRLKGLNIKEILKRRKEKQALIKTLDTKDLIKFGIHEKNRAENSDLLNFHIYTTSMIRYDESTINQFRRPALVEKEAARLKLKLGLERRRMFNIWKAELDKFKGKGVCMEEIYYETAGRYITLIKKRG